MDYKQIADNVLGMLKRADGNDPSRGHLTMDNWEWPTGVALYGIYKTYQQSGDQSILDYLRSWYGDMLHRPTQPHRNVNTVAPALALTCLYDETRDPEYLAAIEGWIDWVMKEMPRTEYGGMQHCTVWNKHYQQLWCDTCSTARCGTSITSSSGATRCSWCACSWPRPASCWSARRWWKRRNTSS